MKKSKKTSKTNWAKVDAYVNTPADYEEIPELTKEWFEAADLYYGNKLIRRGRPHKSVTAKNISLRLDPKVDAYLRATGKGWQTRLNKILLDYIKKHPLPK